MATAAIPLTVGANEINVKVTAQDGTTTKTYTIIGHPRRDQHPGQQRGAGAAVGP